MGILVENQSPVQDNFNFVHSAGGGASLTHEGAIVDTANFSRGITFVPIAFLQAGQTYSYVINESDDENMAGATQVPDERLSNPISDLTETNVIPLNSGAEGTFLNAIGVFQVKRYIQLVGTSSSSNRTVIVYIRANSELQPVTE